MAFLAALGMTAANFAGCRAEGTTGFAVTLMAAIVTTSRVLPATFLLADSMINVGDFAIPSLLALVACTSAGMATWLRIKAHLFTSVMIGMDVGVTEDVNSMVTAGHGLVGHLLAKNGGGILRLPAKRRGDFVATSKRDVELLETLVTSGFARVSAGQAAWMLTPLFGSGALFQTLDGVVEILVVTSIDT
jgi:hypothetical protein